MTLYTLIFNSENFMRLAQNRTNITRILTFRNKVRLPRIESGDFMSVCTTLSLPLNPKSEINHGKWLYTGKGNAGDNFIKCLKSEPVSGWVPYSNLTFWSQLIQGLKQISQNVDQLGLHLSSLLYKYNEKSLLYGILK